MLYLIDILEKNTDEEHKITTSNIIKELEKLDIKAERKSIYDDIEQLNNYGYCQTANYNRVQQQIKIPSDTYQTARSCL